MLRTNGEALEQALNDIIIEYRITRPLSAEIAMNMLSDHDVKIAQLSFITRLCQRCPSILDEILRQVKIGVY
jgi:hypothetical protein